MWPGLSDSEQWVTGGVPGGHFQPTPHTSLPRLLTNVAAASPAARVLLRVLAMLCQAADTRQGSRSPGEPGETADYQ